MIKHRLTYNLADTAFMNIQYKHYNSVEKKQNRDYSLMQYVSYF